jgi:endo-1,3(4)-beta-glucanase
VSPHVLDRVRRPRGVVLVAALVIPLLVLAAGVAALARSGGAGGDTAAAEGLPVNRSDAPVLDPAVVKKDAAALVQRTPKELPTQRLAQGLVPPTNRWYSGLVFGAEAQPVFPLPLGFVLRENGFAFGVPRIQSNEKGVVGSAPTDVSVTVDGVKTGVVTRTDDLSVTVELRDASGRALARVTIAQGTPSITLEALAKTRVGMTPAPRGADLAVTVENRSYAALTDGASVDGASVSVKPGGQVTWFAVPDGGDPRTMAGLVTPVTSGRVAHRVGAKTATTTLTWSGPSGPARLFVAMPHQVAGLPEGVACDLGTFPSVHGTLRVCRGEALTWSAPVRPVTTDLDLSGLSDREREQLSAQVRKDVAGLPPFPADTYFGGKTLQRATQLYRLASRLGLKDAAATVREVVVTELDRWTEPRGCDARPASCFVYDPKNKGVVGLTPSFGSDEFNDHHFHYGYFLYAAGVLGAEDKALAARWRPVIDLLAADIAGQGSAPLMPDRRVFDAYAAHSWASGTSPFADGNNQESTSEAVNAWVGLRLWADATKNAPLRDQATWMLAGEQDSAVRYGLRPDRADPALANFDHEVVSLTWGAKRDYATWFSPEPAAMLGILLLPPTPSSPAYLAGDPARIRAAVQEATAGKGYDQQFGDYLLMYGALAGPDDARAALERARTLDDKWVDDGNSRSYLLAWLMAQQR